jgi:AraC-like DNA-binding protein
LPAPVNRTGYRLSVPRLEPRLTVRAIRPLVSGLRQMGHDPAAVVTAVGLDEKTLSDPDGRVPVSMAADFFARAVAQTGDANLGLHLAEHAELSSFDVHFYAMASSPTLGAAYERLSRYQRLIHETSRVELEIGGKQATLRHRLAGGNAAPRQTAEFLLAAWVRAGRTVTGLNWTPDEVHFAHAAPHDRQEHERIFRSRVRFAMAQNALLLPMSLLQTPCVSADSGLVAVLDRYAVDRLNKAPRTSSAADRVRMLIGDEFRGNTPTAVRIATRLKISVRTLNRLLAAEGTSFRDLLDAVRRELAIELLAGDEASIAEVGFLLGFAELSSFHRAFRRWTGRTPAEFRQAHRG